MKTLLQLKAVQCRYQHQVVVSDCSFSLQKAELVCLLGKSGCGKTTLLRAIAGFESIYRGEIHSKSVLLSSAKQTIPPEQRRIGMVFQDYALFPHLTVEANINFGLSDGKGTGSRCHELLEVMGLSVYNKRYPHELSGGEQQRVALARALAPRPELILLDEPFASLDTALRASLSANIRTLLKQQGTAAILVTHDQEEAFSFADNIGFISDGRLLQWGSPTELYSKPATEQVAHFFDRVWFLSGTLKAHNKENSLVKTELGDLPAKTDLAWPVGSELKLLIRPTDIRLSKASQHKDQGHILSRNFKGALTLYTLITAQGQRLYALVPSNQVYSLGEVVNYQLHFQPGQKKGLVAFKI